MLDPVSDTFPHRNPQERHAIEFHIFPSISGIIGDNARGGL